MFTVKDMNDALKALKDYWIFIVFIGTIVIGWTQFDSRITQTEKDLAEMKVQHASQTAYVNTSLSTLQNSMVQVQTTLEFIKNNIR